MATQSSVEQNRDAGLSLYGASPIIQIGANYINVTASGINIRIADSGDGNVLRILGSGGVERARVTTAGQMKIAGTAVRATTEAIGGLDLFNGTAPVGTLANGVTLYAVAGKLWAMDAAGTATQLTP